MRCCRKFLPGVLAAMLAANAVPARADLAPIEAGADVMRLLDRPRPQTLAVLVNGVAADRLQPFVWTPPNKLVAERRVLESIGIAVRQEVAPGELVDLSDLPEVTYRFDEATQTIAFQLPDRRRAARIYDARQSEGNQPASSPDWGGYLDYSVFGAERHEPRRHWSFSAANATLEAHAFGPYGALNHTFIVGKTPGRSQTAALRLDTTYTLLDQERLLTGRAGDVISGGLAWTRPIRMAGLQLQRDFALQPGLVTQPLPSFAGSAAVPSKVDVFVGATKVYSEKVEPGPYQLVHLPSLANGIGEVVLTDATGRETRTSLSLEAIGALLQPGLADFSAEIGFARRSFGLTSDDYDDRPIASATGRLGMTASVTVEGHVEGGAGLVNGGAGVVAGTAWGTLEGALALSWEQSRVGAQLYAAYDTQLWTGVLIHAGAQWRTDAYDDLASVTARWQDAPPLGAAQGSLLANLAYGLAPVSFRPVKSFAQLSVSAPLTYWSGTVSVALLQRQDATGERSTILTGTVSRALPFQASLFATAFTDLSRHGDVGLLAGINVLLDSDVSASVGGGWGRGSAGTVVIEQPLGNDPGSVGWQVAGTGTGEGSQEAGFAYRSGFGTAAASVNQYGGAIGGTATLDGSLAVMGGAVAAGNQIRNGFALVDAGLPGVAVLQDNRRVGTTDPWGHLLLSNLNAYQANRIALDPLTLPDHGEVSSVESVVVPARASGVRVDFGGDRDLHAATVTLVDGSGRPLPAGATGTLDASGETFIVGYDGLAYLRHLQPSNAVTVETAVGTCHLTLRLEPVAADLVPRTVPCF